MRVQASVGTTAVVAARATKMGKRIASISSQGRFLLGVPAVIRVEPEAVSAHSGNSPSVVERAESRRTGQTGQPSQIRSSGQTGSAVPSCCSRAIGWRCDSYSQPRTVSLRAEDAAVLFIAADVGKPGSDDLPIAIRLPADIQVPCPLCAILIIDDGPQ
jgi:hypothetical protein